MFVRNETYLHPRLRRLLDGPFGATFRWVFAILFAGVFGAVISAAAAPVLVPRLPFIAELVCPAGHRITEASSREVYADRSRAPRSRSRELWLGCRDEDGRLLASDRPHFVIIQTAWALTALALLPAMLAGVNFLFRRRPSGGQA